jgi:hypothetical protein
MIIHFEQAAECKFSELHLELLIRKPGNAGTDDMSVFWIY